MVSPNIVDYQSYPRPDPKDAAMIKQPWCPLIDRKLLKIDSFVSKRTTITVFFTLDVTAFNYLHLIDPVAVQQLVNALISTNILKHHAINTPQLVTDEQHITDLLLQQTVTYNPDRPLGYRYHRVTNLVLHAYQDHNVEWMINREKHPLEITYPITYSHSLEIPEDPRKMRVDAPAPPQLLYCSQQLTNSLNRLPTTDNTERRHRVAGGVLADEMGLGKTLCALMLCMGHRRSDWVIRNRRFMSRATLIIVPNHLCKQWETEIQLIMKPHLNVKIIHLLSRTNFKGKTLKDLLEADFVITSFQYLLSTTVDDPFDNDKRTSSADLRTQLNRYRKQLYTDIRNDRDLINKKGVSLYCIDWHRIIIDEVQEVVKDKFTKDPSRQGWTINRGVSLRDLIMQLTGMYKWILSGTPFAGSKTILNDVGFVLAFLTESWDSISMLYSADSLARASQLFRRNTRASVASEYTPPPLDETIVRIPFTLHERIIYNAYVADKSIDPNDPKLRMLCCHPNLVDEVNAVQKSNKKMFRKKLSQRYLTELTVLQTNLVKYKSQHRMIANRLERMHVAVEHIDDSDVDVSSDDDDDDASDTDSDSSESSESSSDAELDTDNSDTESDSDAESVDSSDSDIIISGQHADNHHHGGDIIIVADQQIEGVPDAIEGMNNVDVVQSGIVVEQLLSQLETLTVNIRTARQHISGKKCSVNFIKNVMKQLKTRKRNSECPICLDDIKRDNMGITMCGHIFCYSCINQSILSNNNCPICRESISKETVHRVNDTDTDQQRKIQQWGSKINYLIKLLSRTRKRVIIFSQWKTQLELLVDILKKNRIGSVFCKGNTHQKNHALIKFRTNENCKVLMMSTDTSVAGANLTEAEYIIFLDPVYGTPEFRKATEDQAISRTLRMGQKAKRVKVWRLIMMDTIEDTIVSEQNNNKPESVAVENPPRDDDVQPVRVV